MSIAGLFVAGVASWLIAWSVGLGMAWLELQPTGRHALSLLDDEDFSWQTRETKR